MRTFIIRARKGSTRWEKIRQSIGSVEHFEIIAHCIMNAFFVANDFRQDVEVYIVLDSAEDFPRTIHLSAQQGLSLSGFHEDAILSTIENALKKSTTLKKHETQNIDKGVNIIGFGFDKLIASLLPTRSIYLLSPKGNFIRQTQIEPNPIFILSDHLCLPPKVFKSLQRKGLKTLSLGKTMLFASQCVVLIHAELDHQDLFMGIASN